MKAGGIFICLIVLILLGVSDAEEVVDTLVEGVFIVLGLMLIIPAWKCLTGALVDWGKE